MDFGTVCPACRKESEQTLDLRNVLDSMRPADYTKTVQAGDMEIFFKPLSYKNINDNNAMQYENQKLLQMLPDTAVPDAEKMTALTAALKRITDITVSAIGQSISAIKTPQALVNEPDFIEEFLTNCDRQLFNQIRDFIIDLKVNSEMQPLKMSCPDCNHKYEQSITLDMSSFFGSAS
jgi:hypothetical protein